MLEGRSVKMEYLQEEIQTAPKKLSSSLLINHEAHTVSKQLKGLQR